MYLNVLAMKISDEYFSSLIASKLTYFSYLSCSHELNGKMSKYKVRVAFK